MRPSFAYLRTARKFCENEALGGNFYAPEPKMACSKPDILAKRRLKWVPKFNFKFVDDYVKSKFKCKGEDTINKGLKYFVEGYIAQLQGVYYSLFSSSARSFYPFPTLIPILLQSQCIVHPSNCDFSRHLRF